MWKWLATGALLLSFLGGVACSQSNAPAVQSTPTTSPSAPTVAATASSPVVTGSGNPDIGKALISSKGCIACHTIQSIPTARGTIGPALDGVASREKIAGGNLSFNDADLRRWLTDPPAVKQDTVMPNLGLTDAEMTDIIAFLKTLE